MKYIRFFKLQCVCAVLLISVGSSFTACTDNIVLKEVDETFFATSDELTGYLSDVNGKRRFTSVEFRSEGSTLFYLKASRKPMHDCTLTMEYDLKALQEYNAENQSTYEAFPKELVTLDANGVFTLKAGERKSSDIKVTYNSDGSLSTENSYVIPLRIKVTSGELKLPDEEAVRLIFLKDLTGIPDCHKASGVKVFSCMEINDTNPLNNLSFTLKSTGQPLIDVLILFSGNVNYNSETGNVYVYNNENIQAMLDNSEHYLKPLRDRGMKIVLGLMGNHDRAGLANLSTETAKKFALEVKGICDAYQLDGVFLDDEWSQYESGDNITPGFVEASSEAASRLCYELKKAQPDRWVIPFGWSYMGLILEVDGLQMGEFVDYTLPNYGDYSGDIDLTEQFPGLPKGNIGHASMEFARGMMWPEENLRKMRMDGYLTNMIFAMDPYRENFESEQLPTMRAMARAFHDDELVFDGIKYPKDWK